MGCGISKSKTRSRRASSKRLSDAIGITPGMFLAKYKGKLSSNYLEVKKIGSGAFAEVKLCTYLPTGQDRAVKLIHKAGLHQQQIDEDFMLKEISVLTSLDHPNILRCFEIFEDSWRFYVSMEYCAGGELFSKIISLKKFNETQAAQIMQQLLSAVGYCHEKLVIHRDLKPENILLEEKDGDLSIKVADFGSSCFLDTGKRLSGCFGSAYYVAPEVLQDEYNEKCDIWSCGVIMFIMLTGKPPYPGKDSKTILNLVKTRPLVITPDRVPGVSEGAVDLLKKMLEIRPKSRVAAKDALQHPWLTSFGQPEMIPADLSGTLSQLEQFNSSAMLKDAVHVFLATQVLSHEEAKALTAAFKSLDTNSDGKISRQELLTKYLETMEEAKARATVDHIFQEVDSNMSGDIDYSKFLTACMNYSKYLSKETLEVAFKVFDKDNSGFITEQELRAVLGGNGDMPKGVWNEIMSEVDQNGDGVIDLREFVTLMTSKI